MVKHEKQTFEGEGGNITIENVSLNSSTAYFKFTVETKSKSFVQKLKDLFKSEKTACTFYLDRIPAKYVSTYIYNHVTAADKAYKADKVGAPKVGASRKVKRNPSTEANKTA